MEVTIQAVRPEEAVTIATLILQLGYRRSAAETEEQIKVLAGDPRHLALSAMVTGKTVGWIHAYVVLQLESPPFVEIAGLVVDENFRGKGIGKKLLREVEKWTSERGVGKLRVRTNELRKDAPVFYERQGFVLAKNQMVFDKRVSG